MFDVLGLPLLDLGADSLLPAREPAGERFAEGSALVGRGALVLRLGLFLCEVGDCPASCLLEAPSLSTLPPRALGMPCFLCAAILFRLLAELPSLSSLPLDRLDRVARLDFAI